MAYLLCLKAKRGNLLITPNIYCANFETIVDLQLVKALKSILLLLKLTSSSIFSNVVLLKFMVLQ